jgi:hypothetical protein
MGSPRRSSARSCVARVWLGVSESTYIAETLAWCNALRKERGKAPLKKLPRGERYEGESCPCGKATGLFVERYGAYVSRQEFERSAASLVANTTPSVRRFIGAFDLGDLPQYEVGS